MLSNEKYIGGNTGIVIPTKNRPKQVDNLLRSLVSQNIQFGKIIIVYCGDDISSVIDNYTDCLNVELYKSEMAGQLVQRNYGLSKLGESIKLVALFDDDIVLEDKAFAAIMEFISENDECAGVSFNIINHPPEKMSPLKTIFGLSGNRPGLVLKSGLTTSSVNIDKNIRAQWLCGGATVWKKDILDRYQHNNIITKWAIAEDLIFSYPVGKLYPLYVCANAQVRHEHVNDYVGSKHEKYHGYTQTIWLYYFVSKNDELSLFLFFYTLIVRLIVKIIRGITKMDKKSLYFSEGQLKGMYICIKTLISRKNIEDVLDER